MPEMLAAAFSRFWWAPLVVILAYTPASLVMFPRWLITLMAVAAFGPWAAFAYAQTGVLVALLILACSLVGGALEDALNPRLRVAHLSARTFRLRPLVGRGKEAL